MRQFRVDLVYEVGEICGSFVVHTFEEHDGFEVFSEVLNFVVGQLSLQDFDDIFLLGVFYFLSQVDDFFLHVNQTLHIFAHFADSHGILAHYLSAYGLDLYVGFVGDLVDEITNGQLCTLREDVEDVFAFDKARVFNGRHNGSLAFSRNKLSRFGILFRLFEQDYAVVIHKILQKLLFFEFEKKTSFCLQLQHLFEFFVIIVDREVWLSLVYDHYHTLLYIFEGLEGLQQIFSQLGQLVRSCLADVRIVDHQNHLHLWVDVQKPLHEE